MHRLIILSVATIAFSLSGCRKDDAAQAPVPDPSKPLWTSYTMQNSALPDNQVTALAVDRNDVKWIGTAQGLARLEQGTWTIYDEKNSPLPSSRIQAISLGDDGAVWVGTNKGLAKFNQASWTVWTTGNSNMNKNSVLSMAWDSKGKNLWAGFEGSFIKIDAQHQMTHYDDLDDLILSLAVDSSGVLWMGTFNHFAFRGRIKRFHLGQWQNYNLDDLGYASTFPYALIIDQQQHPVVLLTGTSVKNTIRFKQGRWEELAVPDDLNAIKTLLADKEKIWIGGDKLSVLGDKKFTSLVVPGIQVQIQALALDSQGARWVGTLNGGLAVCR